MNSRISSTPDVQPSDDGSFSGRIKSGAYPDKNPEAKNRRRFSNGVRTQTWDSPVSKCSRRQVTILCLGLDSRGSVGRTQEDGYVTK